MPMTFLANGCLALSTRYELRSETCRAQPKGRKKMFLIKVESFVRLNFLNDFFPIFPFGDNNGEGKTWKTTLSFDNGKMYRSPPRPSQRKIKKKQEKLFPHCHPTHCAFASTIFVSLLRLKQFFMFVSIWLFNLEIRKIRKQSQLTASSMRKFFCQGRI